MNTIDENLVQSYLSECAENLAIMEKSVISLEMSGSAANVVHSHLLRAAHAVRTAAGFCGLTRLIPVAERTERALAPICFEHTSLTPEQVTVFLRAIDTLRALLEDSDGSDVDTSAILGALAALGTRPSKVTPRRGADWRLHVLLAEDDFTSRLLLQSFLSRYGDCHVAVNGREAVAAFRLALEQGQKYDLVCMDIMMPEMDGREAIRQIRALEEARGIYSTEGAKILMTTAVNDLKEVMRSFRDLCDAYLVKPIDLAQLLGHMKAYDLVRTGDFPAAQ